MTYQIILLPGKLWKAQSVSGGDTGQMSLDLMREAEETPTVKKPRDSLERKQWRQLGFTWRE